MSEEKENYVEKDKATEDNSSKNKIDKNKPVKNKEKSKNKFYLIVPILVVIIFSLGFIFVNDRLNKIEEEVSQNILKNSGAVEENDDLIKGTLSRFTGIQKKLEALTSKQDALSHTLSQPVEQQIHVNKDYALAEIEHLLIIANYNLQLDHNVATALSAMESADARLTGLTGPSVLSVREQLISDMNTLRSLNQADLSGLSLFLSDLINRVDALPLKENIVLAESEQVDEPVKEPVEGIKHFFALVFDELKSLIVITRDKDISKARLLPDEVYFLKANLKLELANARFSVFNRDTDNLHASIEHIQTWLSDYFNLSDAAVKNIYDSLSEMKKTDLSFPEIDINSSLESVRALSHYQDESNDVEEEGLVPLQ